MPYNSFGLGFVTGSALLGAVAGAISFGILSDKVGRELLYGTYPFLFFAFSVLSALSANVFQLTVFRFLQGIGIGADYALGPVYAMESDTSRKHGKSYGWIWVMWSVGAGASFLSGFILLNLVGTDAWRWVFIVISVPSLLLALIRVIVIRGKRKSERITPMLEGLPSETEEKSYSDGRIRNGTSTTVGKLFRGDYGIRTAIIWIQWILYDIVDYGVALYSPLIVSELGIKGSYSLIVSASFYLPGSLGSIGAAFGNDKFGRRTLQISGFSGMGIGIAMITCSFFYLGSLLIFIGIFGLYIFYGIGNLGPGNTTGLYAIELLPRELRSTSMGLATAVTRFTAFLSAFEFPLIALTLGRTVFFEVLLGITLSALIFTILFTPETKGVSLEDVSNAKYERPKLDIHRRGGH